MKAMKIFFLITVSLLPSLVFAQFANTAFFRNRAPGLRFTTSTQNLMTWNCSSVVTVQTRTPAGVAYNVATNLTVSLAGAGSLSFYSDADCMTPITSVTILAGQSSASFYFMDTAAGSHETSVAATGFQTVSQFQTVTANAYVWTGAGGNTNWSTGSNWSGGVAPVNPQVAIFNSSCSSNCSPTIDASIDVGGIKMLSGYAGTISQSSGATITIRGAGWNQQAGTFLGTAGTGNIILWGNWYLSGGTFTAPSGTLNFTSQTSLIKVTNSPTFNHHSGIFQIDNCSSPVFTPGNITINNLTITNACNWSGSTIIGTLNVAGDIMMESSSYQGTFGDGGTINLSGSILNKSQAWGFAGSCLVRFVGGFGSSVTVSSTQTYPSPIGAVEIASLGTVTWNNNVVVNGNFTYTSGTFNAGTSNVSFTGSIAINSGNAVFYDVTIAMGPYNSGNLIGTLYVGHDLYLSHYDGRAGFAGGTFDVKHNVIATSNVNWGSAAINLSGASAQNISAIADSNFYSGNITVNTTGGAVVSLGSAVTLNGSNQTLTVNSGSVNMAGYALDVKSLSLNSNTITRNSGALTVNGTVVGAGTVSAYGGTIAP
jgi:hypothetical protein